MAVTAAPARQALAIRGVQEGKLAGDQQENKFKVSMTNELPYCSLDRHNNLICANHVESTARSRFNGPRVST